MTMPPPKSVKAGAMVHLMLLLHLAAQFPGGTAFIFDDPAEPDTATPNGIQRAGRATEYDPCLVGPCLNGGTCIIMLNADDDADDDSGSGSGNGSGNGSGSGPDVAEFACVCGDGYLGETCGQTAPSTAPTVGPSTAPSTTGPTAPGETFSPTKNPTAAPTTSAPTVSPTTSAPTVSPTTSAPTVSPTTSAPTTNPTQQPSTAPSTPAPSDSPTSYPTIDTPASATQTIEITVAGDVADLTQSDKDGLRVETLVLLNVASAAAGSSIAISSDTVIISFRQGSIIIVVEFKSGSNATQATTRAISEAVQAQNATITVNGVSYAVLAVTTVVKTNNGDGAESNDNTASMFYAAIIGGALFFVVVVGLACAKSYRAHRAKKRDMVTVGPRTEVWSFEEEKNPDSSTQSHAAGNGDRKTTTLADMDDVSNTAPKQKLNQVGPESYV